MLNADLLFLRMMCELSGIFPDLIGSSLSASIICYGVLYTNKRRSNARNECQFAGVCVSILIQEPTLLTTINTIPYINNDPRVVNDQIDMMHKQGS